MEPAPVRMILKWSVPHGESRHIVSALQGLMLSTRAQAGCVGCSLSTDVPKHRRVDIQYVEEWSSEDDLNSRLRSGDFAALAELMEHASEYPRMEFALPGSTRGVDYVEEVRGTGTH
jgi:quinol monooxygenase YgiN